MKFESIMKKSLLLLVLLSLFIGIVSFASAVPIGEDHQITLLSVTELSDGTQTGDLAFLKLQVRPGEGSVFLDSFPATRIDTQVSARMANEIACSYSSVDCSKYDFFYTIEASAATIGGPSAGAAITLLTLSVLEDKPLIDKLAVTGAISSGGIIMPVDGIKEKVQASDRNDYDLVIIPKLAISQEPANSNLSNQTNYLLSQEDLNLGSKFYQSDFENFSIEIFEAETLEEAFFKSTKEHYVLPQAPELIVPKDYTTKMKATANKLCERSDELFFLTKNFNETELEPANDFIENAIKARNEGQSYSRASYCYSANVNLRTLLLSNFTQEELFLNLDKLINLQNEFEEKLEVLELKTFSDLEAYSIVKERLLESKNYVNEINKTNISSDFLAAGIERFYSAEVWSGFFGMQGEELDLNPVAIKQACEQELQSVYTRTNYLQTFIPKYLLQDLFSEISGVTDYIHQENYELCLFKASKAKSLADFLITSATLNNDTVNDLVHRKQQVATNLISFQQENDVFPILGYSYLEYSKSLENDSIYSSLMFAENSIAFSDLSKYFLEESNAVSSPEFKIRNYEISIFASGLVIGLFVGFLLFTRTKKVHRKHKRISFRKH